LDIDQVYQRFTEQVSTLIPFDRATIILFDDEHDALITAYQKGFDVPEGNVHRRCDPERRARHVRRTTTGEEPGSVDCWVAVNPFLAGNLPGRINRRDSPPQERL
jgi:hypothetical protein